MFLGCKILILPKSNQIYPNLNHFWPNMLSFAQISPKFFFLLFVKYGSTILARKHVWSKTYANPSSFPNPKSNPNTNPPPKAQ